MGLLAGGGSFDFNPLVLGFGLGTGAIDDGLIGGTGGSDADGTFSYFGSCGSFDDLIGLLLCLATGLRVCDDGAGETPSLWGVGVSAFVESSGSLEGVSGDVDEGRELYEAAFSYTPSEVSLTTWRHENVVNNSNRTSSK